MQIGLKSVLVFSCLALVAGCGNSIETVAYPNPADAGSGGSSASSTSASSGGTGGSSSSSSTSSSGEVCHPSEQDPLVQQCAPNDTCVCNPTATTEDSWCNAWAEKSIFICPEDANICFPGHNQCGYDLPKGEDYILPDPECAEYINGDTWAGDTVVESNYNNNGQMEVRFYILEPNGSHFNGFLVHGKKLLWSNANWDSYEWAEGHFSGDCKQIIIDYYPPLNGSDTQIPWHTTAFSWSHD